MRDYSEDNIKDVKTYLRAAKDSTNHNYIKSYSSQVIPSKYRHLKSASIDTGNDAYYHIKSIRDRVENAYNVLCKYYNSIDTTSNNIKTMSEKIKAILDEVNSSMDKINCSLNGIGNYAGKKASPDDIRAAGIDESRCANLKAQFFDSYMNNDYFIASYIDKIKALQEESGTIPPEEMDKLNKMYDWYVKNRYAPEVVTYVDKQRLKNCIDIYELFNPDAKNTTDVFFEPAINDEYYDENVEKNILCIKYMLYTCDPAYRDLILAYMKNDVKLNSLPPDKKVCTQSSKIIDGKKVCVLNINLHRENSDNCCSFFHEFGHGVDYLSGSDNNSSYGFYKSLISDFTNTITNYLSDRNKKLKPEEQLSGPEMTEIINYLLYGRNPNAVWKQGEDIKSALPKTWTEAQKNAYEDIRNYYGYKEYVIGDPDIKYKAATCPDIVNSGHAGGIIRDIMGGITNDKICGAAGHGFQHYGENYVNYNTPDELRDDLSTNKSGWYYEPGKSTPAFLTEFFAEEFEYSVFNRDKSPTNAFFPTGGDAFEKKIKEICGGI